MIRNIPKQLEALQQDNWTELASLLNTFQKLSGVSYYLDMDKTAFPNRLAYVQFLEQAAQLIKPEVALTQISSAEEGECWVFRFQLDDQEASIELPNLSSGIFQGFFLEDLNRQLEPFTTSRLRPVFAMSAEQADQSLHVVFIEDNIFDRLRVSKPHFA